MKSGTNSQKSIVLSFLSVIAIAFALSTASAPAKARGKKNEAEPYAALEKVPAKARAWRNPFEHDLNATLAGQKLFAEHCAECHGNLAEGGRKAPSLRVEEIRDSSGGTLFWILTNGVVRRGMPVWSKLPEPERWQLVTFLKSLPPETSSEPKQSR